MVPVAGGVVILSFGFGICSGDLLITVITAEPYVVFITCIMIMFVIKNGIAAGNRSSTIATG
jgi:hypothetical protein